MSSRNRKSSSKTPPPRSSSGASANGADITTAVARTSYGTVTIVDSSVDDASKSTSSSREALLSTNDDDNNNTPYAGNGDAVMVENDGLMRDIPLSSVASKSSNNPNDDDGNESDDDDDDDDDDIVPIPEMTIEELLYSSSSYYAIARPVTITMILAALLVVYVNTDSTVQQGQQAMAEAYQVWDLSSSKSAIQSLFISLANAFVMVSVICCMTFIIVVLYKYKCMKCLIGYMITTSATLLGILGGNVFSTFLTIYNIPIDYLTFYLFMANFAVVGVLAVFWGQGIPKYITQAYLIATSVILAWHLSYFDDWTTWTLLFMLAVYDLCAVLSPCGPLKALVNLMSQDDAPEMPGLLFEAELPPEAKRPSKSPRNANGATTGSSGASAATPTAGGGGNHSGTGDTSSRALASPSPRSTGGLDSGTSNNDDNGNTVVGSAAYVGTDNPGQKMKLPFAIAKVYQLQVVEIPPSSKKYFNNTTDVLDSSNVSASPLLAENHNEGSVVASGIVLPENPTAEQLRASVIVQLPGTGGRLEQVSKRGKKVYLERDRHGDPKRLVWCDRSGKVFAEVREDDDEAAKERNSIRLGLGDFIFYSVLVSKAAQYSFTTFAVCMLVILSGLGGTLVLLSVYHHALPALPISIFLGVIFYLLTRIVMLPWIEMILTTPYYV